MKKIIIFILLLATAPTNNVRADIYRLEGDDDTISFTDSPKDKRFQLVMKEQPARKIKTGANKRLEARTEQQADNMQLSTEPAYSAMILPLQGRITSTTGMRNDPIDGKLKHHNGIDIAASSGTPVKPVAPGKVIFSGWKPGYGNTVILDHQNGMTTVYAHHESNSVTAGSFVDNETVIAHSGSTGRSTGPHLHFEAWRNGINITADFMPGNMATSHSDTYASAPINRYLQADGTIIFTNLR